MNIPFYDNNDLFCTKGAKDFKSSLDLFYKRLLLVGDMMHITHAKKIAKRRTKFLKQFLREFELELKESNIIKIIIF